MRSEIIESDHIQNLFGLKVLGEELCVWAEQRLLLVTVSSSAHE